jgi:uncharacterized protein
MTTKLLCDIYKSTKVDEMYLYVSRGEGLARVPQALLQKFGTPKQAMTLILQAGKKLARADIDVVLSNLNDNGFYLQMPPQKETYMQEINLHNSKL